MTENTPVDAVPLCIDLDGTLIASDTLVESLLTLIRQQPWTIFLLPFWLLQGRAGFKEHVSARISLDAAHLPYRTQLLDFLREEKQRGRKLILTTAANDRVAESVAEYLKLFGRVIASGNARNLKGRNKARVLVAEFGERGFDYAGDSTADFPVWAASRRAVVVGRPSFVQKVGRLATVEKIFSPVPGGLKEWFRALRVYQWVKNLLVFVPLVASHRMTEADLLVQALIAFLAFSLCASSVYIINDLFDLEADRAHPRKSSRPFASGRLSIVAGGFAAPVLLLAAAALALMLPLDFALILGLYFVTTFLYSVRLKRTTMVDVLVLAGLYTMRLIAGAQAVSVPLSFWLLAFSMFLFLSLALVKRVAELRLQGADATKVAGRAYSPQDLPVLMAMGTASGYTCVLVLALYINSNTSSLLYSRPEALWLLCPLLLLWISRVWLVTYRGQMHHDPIVFAFRDSISRWLVVPAAAVLWVAI